MTDLDQNFIMNAAALEIIKRNLDNTNFDGLSVRFSVCILPTKLNYLSITIIDLGSS